jgi:hypothetical protein
LKVSVLQELFKNKKIHFLYHFAGFSTPIACNEKLWDLGRLAAAGVANDHDHLMCLEQEQDLKVKQIFTKMQLI